MDFRKSLSHSGFQWETAYSLALASKLAYRPEPGVEHVVKEVWQFPGCRSFHAGETRAFLAWDENLLLIAFRGTAGLSDWKINGDFLLEPRHQFSVHRGFYNAFKRIQGELEAQIKALDNRPRRCFLTGHSLGGALASIAGAYLWKTLGDKFGPQCVTIYTYGQPCPGDDRFKNYCAQVVPAQSFRFVNEDDIVTKLPPALGYQQVEAGIYFTASGELGTRGPDDAGVWSEAEYKNRSADVDLALEWLEDYDGERSQAQERSLFGIAEHFIDAYIRKIGKKITETAQEGLEGDRSLRLRPQGEISTADTPGPATAPVLPPGGASVPNSAPPGGNGSRDSVTPPDSGRVAAEEKDGQSAEQLDNPLEVHVLWTKRSAAEKLCNSVAEQLFRFLSHRPTGHPDLESGAGIPTFAGFHYSRVLQQLEKCAGQIRAELKRIASLPKDEQEAQKKALLAEQCNRPAIVVIALLEQEARIDEEFRIAWGEIRTFAAEDLWPRVLILPVALDLSWTGDQAGNGPVFSRGAQFTTNLCQKARAATREVVVAICHFLADRRDRERRVNDPCRRRVRVFLSHSKSDLEKTRDLAKRLKEKIQEAKLKTFFDTEDVALGTDLGPQLFEAQKDAICLSVRTDRYSQSPYCHEEILTAKKLRVPIVSVVAITEKERRSHPYAGNSIVLACPNGTIEDYDRVLDECMRARLHHLHFQRYAPLMVNRKLPGRQPIVLTRSPELLDFSFPNDALPQEAGTIIFYPDPPLPQSESNILRRAFPKVQTATPTTLFQIQNLYRPSRNPMPPLHGIRVALSLSESSELAKEFKDIRPDCPGSSEMGLLLAHLNQTIAYLTLCLIRCGAELGYGGHLGSFGYTDLLSYLIEAHKLAGGTAQDFLHSYVASYVWDSKPEASDTIVANFLLIQRKEESSGVWFDDKMPVESERERANPEILAEFQGRKAQWQQWGNAPLRARNALEMSLVRQMMADDKLAQNEANSRVFSTGLKACDARIILGGKTNPKNPDIEDGYTTRFPGQAEEALYHLRQWKRGYRQWKASGVQDALPPLKPLYVVGGYYGSARQVALALQKKRPVNEAEADERATNEDFRKLCRWYDELRVENEEYPTDLRRLWEEISGFGEGVFSNAPQVGPDTWPIADFRTYGYEWPPNGLTRAENVLLLESVDPDEISSLILKGLLALYGYAARKAGKLQVCLFHGPITSALQVEAYGVFVMSGLALRGVDGALDDRVDGRISQFLESIGEKKQSDRNKAFLVKDDRLAGDWVLLQLTGDLAEVRKMADTAGQVQWLKDAICNGAKGLVAQMKQRNVTSIAVVPTFVNLGLTVEESIDCILEGLLVGVADPAQEPVIENLVICELDPARYEQLAEHFACERTDPVTGKKKQSQHGKEIAPELKKRLSVVELQPDVPREPVQPTSSLQIRLQDGMVESVFVIPTSSPVHEIVRKPLQANRLFLDTKDCRSNVVRQLELGRALAQELLFGEAKHPDLKALGETSGRYLEVFVDQDAAAIPIELLYVDLKDGNSHFPALHNGLSRSLLTSGLSHSRRYRRVGVKLKLLLVADPTKNLPFALKEAARIENELKDRSEIQVDILKQDEATRAQVLQRLEQDFYDFIHFAGHGAFREGKGEGAESWLVFPDGRLTSAELAKLKMDRAPALVFLNACEVGRIEPDTPREDRAVVSDLASAILRSGVCAFIGNQWPVQDNSASDFAATLYRCLADGESLGAAVMEARRELYRAKMPDWANYVFYGSPEIRV